MEQLATLYQAYTGTAPDKVTELPASGSNRRYFRLEGSPTLIGVVGTCLEENEAFLYMADHFLKHNIPVPRVVAVADDRMSYLKKTLATRCCSEPSRKDASPARSPPTNAGFLPTLSACSPTYSLWEPWAWTSPNATRRRNSTPAR